MRRYVLDAGEVEVLKELADGIRDDKRMSGIVILTDRRLVALVARKPSAMSRFLGGLLGGMVGGGLLGGMLTGREEAASLELMHQIERDDFATVEQEPHRQMISFHSKGEGYAHISFAVYSQTPFTTWQQRMHQWAAGTLTAAPIPTAKLVER
jgi:hypothetical protein